MFDQILKQVGQQFGLGDKTGDLVGMIAQHIQKSGGLGGLLQGFQKQGLTSQADSWVSTGENQSISPDQAAAAFGPDFINDAAAQLGVDPSQVSEATAHMVPEMVDKMTPNGSVPENHNFMDDLQKMLPGNLNLQNLNLGDMGGMLGGLLGGNKQKQ